VAPVWLIVGVQASGKSTTADGLARRFDHGVHLRGGHFYRSAVTGWVHPSPAGAGDDEARRLLDLRYRLSAQVASEYCAAGFTTVVQDNIFGDDVVHWLSLVTGRPRHLVVLRPSIEVVYERDRARMAATGKVAYRPGDFTVEHLDAALDSILPIGLWLDTSSQEPEETVDTILRRADEASVEEAVS
jgi:hypothetical protein